MTPRSRLIAAGFALCALGLLGWALARAFAMLAAPPLVADTVKAQGSPDLQAVRASLATAELFGRPAPVQRAAEAPPRTELRLLGVYAAPGRDSYALLVVDGKAEVTAEGREIRPGLVLQEVGLDYAVVRRQGTPERLEFPSSGAAK